MTVTDGKTYSFYKLAKPFSNFITHPEAIQTLNKFKRSDFMLLMGHTRAPTRGAVIDSNAHPYKIKRFIFCHNGVIQNFDDLQKDFSTNFEVDSQIIGYLLNYFPEVEVFGRKLNGWYTVPYLRVDNLKKLNIATHNGSLALAILPGGSGMYFSSTPTHLKQALADANLNCNVVEIFGTKLLKFEWKNQHLDRTHIEFRKLTTPKTQFLISAPKSSKSVEDMSNEEIITYYGGSYYDSPEMDY